jgi:hypothetical protein
MKSNVTFVAPYTGRRRQRVTRKIADLPDDAVLEIEESPIGFESTGLRCGLTQAGIAP